MGRLISCYLWSFVQLTNVFGQFIIFRDTGLYEGHNCVTADLDIGLCTRIHDCEEILGTVLRSKFEDVHCGFADKRVPLVCCPLGLVNQPGIPTNNSPSSLPPFVPFPFPVVTTPRVPVPLPQVLIPVGVDPGPSTTADLALQGCGVNSLTEAFVDYKFSTALRLAGASNQNFEEALMKQLNRKIEQASSASLDTIKKVNYVAQHTIHQIARFPTSSASLDYSPGFNFTPGDFFPFPPPNTIEQEELNDEEAEVFVGDTGGEFLIGAITAFPAAWPWMVMLGNGLPSSDPQWMYNGTEFFCDGIIIGFDHILTAAHCFKRNPTVVRIGEHDTTDPFEFTAFGEYPRDIKIADYYIHPDYNQRRLYNDIAIIRLSEPVTLGLYPAAVCLPGPFANLAGNANVTLSGWGATSFLGPRSTVLRTLRDLPLVPSEECEKPYLRVDGCDQCRLPDGIPEGLFCAGDTIRGQRDACQGDSGGPAMVQSPETGRWTLVGIVSGGNGCGNSEFPGILTNVEYYLPWIRNVTAL